jgi:hypothetical protein
MSASKVGELGEHSRMRVEASRREDHQPEEAADAPEVRSERPPTT